MKHQIETVAGGENSFLEATKLELSGSQCEIGAMLARHAISALELTPLPAKSAHAVREQRCFMQRHWPAHYQRMLGAAKVLDVDPENDEYDLSVLLYGVGVPGCSVVFYPPSRTESQEAILSRNFDYTTGRVAGIGNIEPVAEHFEDRGGKPTVSQPFLIHTKPDQGFECLFMCAYDLLGGATDGINSEGLAVALMADIGTTESRDYRRRQDTGVGINEMQTVRFLLENCSNAKNARETLLNTEQIYLATPCHYMIADASGDAFIWEFDPLRQTSHITDGTNEPLVCTNHLIYDGAPANTTTTDESRNRYRRLKAQIASHPSRVSETTIRETNRQVAAVEPAGEGQYISDTPARTLWYAHYNLSDRSLCIDFYLGEQSGKIVRSNPSRHQL